MALILLCEEDIDPTGSDVRCVRNDRICDIILQLYLSAQCQITPLTKNETGPHMEQLSHRIEKSCSSNPVWNFQGLLRWVLRTFLTCFLRFHHKNGHKKYILRKNCLYLDPPGRSGGSNFLLPHIGGRHRLLNIKKTKCK